MVEGAARAAGDKEWKDRVKAAELRRGYEAAGRACTDF
jgi:hypothetical protein